MSEQGELVDTYALARPMRVHSKINRKENVDVDFSQAFTEDSIKLRNFQMKVNYMGQKNTYSVDLHTCLM